MYSSEDSGQSFLSKDIRNMIVEVKLEGHPASTQE